MEINTEMNTEQGETFKEIVKQYYGAGSQVDQNTIDECIKNVEASGLLDKCRKVVAEQEKKRIHIGKLSLNRVACLICAVCSALLLCGFGYIVIKDAYDYDATGWKSKTATMDKIEACDIPEDTLKKMTTEALVETVITYPYFSVVTAYSSPTAGLEEGIEALNQQFGGLKELMTREDAYQCTLDLINSICPDILDLKPDDDWDEFMKVFNEKNKTKFDIIHLINADTLLKILKDYSK